MARTPKPTSLSLTAFSNILKCRSVTASTRNSYLSYLSGAGADAVQAKRLHDVFRRRKKFSGPVVPVAATEGLGNLAPLDDLKKYSYAFFNKPGRRGMTYDAFRDMVDDWVAYHENRAAGRAFTSKQNAAALDIEGRTVIVRDEDAIWLFRNPGRTTYAFDGVLDGFLRPRLGLLPRGTRLTLSFKAANVTKIHRPTFLDATWDYLDLWDASGNTRPIASAAGGRSGLEEVVATPPLFRDLNGPVLKA